MTSQSQNLFPAQALAQADSESYLARRLASHNAYVYPVTESFTARERFRQAILDHKLDWVIIGKSPDGWPETYAQAFKRIYGEPLVAKSRKRGESAAVST